MQTLRNDLSRTNVEIGTLLTNLISIRYKSKDKGRKKKKDKEAANTTPQKKQQKKLNNLEGTNCFFCGAERHKKKYCTNYHAWHAKEGVLLNLVFF